MRMNIKPVIFFDWDGTIGDSMALCLGEVRLALRRIGHGEVDEELIRACNGPTHEQSVGVLGLDPAVGPAFIRERIRAEQELIPELLQVYPGSRDMLECLSRRATRASASNGQEAYILRSLEVTGMAHYFARVQAAIPGKTKPDILKMLIDELQPTHAVMVGDRATDFEAGRSCQLPLYCARYGYGDESEWAMADYQADSVQELCGQLQTWLDTTGA